jgi:hypothetical protein
LRGSTRITAGTLLVDDSTVANNNGITNRK